MRTPLWSKRAHYLAVEPHSPAEITNQMKLSSSGFFLCLCHPPSLVSFLVGNTLTKTRWTPLLSPNISRVCLGETLDCLNDKRESVADLSLVYHLITLRWRFSVWSPAPWSEWSDGSSRCPIWAAVAGINANDLMTVCFFDKCELDSTRIVHSSHHMICCNIRVSDLLIDLCCCQADLQPSC